MVAISLPFRMPQAKRSMMPSVVDGPALAELPSEDGKPKGSSREPQSVLVVERCSATAIAEHAAAWAGLAERALEPNVFMEPGFAIPASRCLAPAHGPTFLLCWDHADGAEPVLVGLLALRGGAPAAMAWHHPLWVTSAPLLDRERAAGALEAMLAALATQPGGRGGLMLRGVPLDGPLMRLLESGPARRHAVLDRRVRAVLRRPDDSHGPAPALSAKHAKEMRRQRRRLADDGACVLRSARTVEEVRVATERFLVLEARGWKGARGTALLGDPQLATFTRTMTRLLARKGLCRIDTLEVGGRVAAAGIVISSGDRAFFWKTAYDESLRRQSPGKLLAAEIGLLQRGDPTVALTDSCAAPDHPMIDKLWKDRMVVADLLVAGPATGRARFAAATAAIRLGMTARQAAKAAVHGLKARLLRR